MRAAHLEAEGGERRERGDVTQCERVQARTAAEVEALQRRQPAYRDEMRRLQALAVSQRQHLHIQPGLKPETPSRTRIRRMRAATYPLLSTPAPSIDAVVALSSSVPGCCHGVQSDHVSCR